MRAVGQIVTVTLLNLSGLTQRLLPSLVLVAGIALVVGVLLSLLSFSMGLKKIIVTSSAPDRVILTASGTNREIDSSISRSEASVIMDAPQVRKDVDGRAIASAETLTLMPGRWKGRNTSATLVIRGLGEKGIMLRPNFRLVSGRLFEPGNRELIVGKAAHEQFDGLDIGNRVPMTMGPWTIVGIFSNAGDQFESELFGDAETVLSATQKNGFGSVTVDLSSPHSFEGLREEIAGNPALHIEVERQSDFYVRTSGQFTSFVTSLAYGLGGIMAIGALVGTLNIMYSAVDSRTREIAILRAIGFGATPVTVSVIVEALVLAMIGALIGAVASWLLFNQKAAAHEAYAFHLLVTREMIALGIAWALTIALLGCILPAIAASRLFVATALRPT